MIDEITIVIEITAFPKVVTELSLEINPDPYFLHPETRVLVCVDVPIGHFQENRPTLERGGLFQINPDPELNVIQIYSDYIMYVKKDNKILLPYNKVPY